MKILHALSLGLLLVAFPVSRADAQATIPSIVLEPSSLELVKANEFTVTVSARTGGQRVNAVEFIIAYTTDTLMFKEFASESSLFEIVAPGAGDSDGEVTMARATIDPIQSENAIITDVIFTVIEDGPASISVSNTSKLLNASDSQNILGSTFIFTGQVGDEPQSATGSSEGAVNEIALTGEPVGPGTVNQEQALGQPDEETQQSVGSGQSGSNEERSNQDTASAHAANTTVDTEGKQWIVAGITGGGVLLVIISYGYIRYSARKNGLPLRHVLQNDDGSVSSVRPDTLPRSPEASHDDDDDDVDALLNEVHGVAVKNAEVKPKNSRVD